MRLLVQADSTAPAAAARDMRNALAVAVTAGMQDAGALLKQRARQNVSQAGFSQRWQNTIRVTTFPSDGRPSLDPAAYLRDTVPYSGVFEDGATIRGAPLLWIPLRSTPQLGGRKPTPSLWARQVGPLVSVNRPGKPPLLFGPLPGNRQARVPLFVGESSVTIRKRFDIHGVAEGVAAELPSLVSRHLKG